MREFIARVWLIGCSRCANEGVSDANTSADATDEFRLRGWTTEYPRVFCPQCSKETGRNDQPQ